MMEQADDQPQWYWAVDGGFGVENYNSADDRFVVACGQRELWRRAKSEVNADHCSWLPFGPSTGDPTLADCFGVYVFARECYGVSHNRLVLELSVIPAFARCIRDSPLNYCDWVANPIALTPLPRPRYDQKVEAQLCERIEVTLAKRGRPEADD